MLKRYQQRALDKLQEYLEVTATHGPKHAFLYAADEKYNDASFDETPFVCVKIPTGGGKTFVACHATSHIMTAFERSAGLVLWFVPSEAIKTQTLKKFKDRKDLHRKILDERFDNSVKILSNEEALRITKDDIANNLCIVVASLDAFRKEKSLQNKYKVYQENGALINHFEHIDDHTKLEQDESGIITSLANVIRLHNPILVIDEGHKTKTQLSIEFLKDLNPAFIIEYTATPREGSNILVNVTASELKEEEMVKLPLVLESHTQWQDAVLQGILRRTELEKLAKKEGIRPVALLQATPDRKSDVDIDVERLKRFLLERKIPEEEIAIKTSKHNQLEGIDLFSMSCKIRYIITVNALAEGWDCSFAYILISVANIGAKIAVEQIIGRIMRMPYAKRRSNAELNQSYVFASAKNFNEAATQIITGLESNGYSKVDLVNASEKKTTTAYEVTRRVEESFTTPLLAIDGEPLTGTSFFDDDFQLRKQPHTFIFHTHYDSDGVAIIDVKDERWTRSGQQILKTHHHDKTITKEQLVGWLDKRLRFTMFDKDDKVAFITSCIDQIKGHSVSDLSANRYALLEQLGRHIDETVETYAKERFDDALKKGTITLVDSEPFPATITLEHPIPQEFNKNYYRAIDKLNKEELRFIGRLDLETLPNIVFWIRNRERKDSFYLQGWRRHKFYPDFIAKTKRGNIIAMEWKGEDRLTNDDTSYKETIGKLWERLGSGKLHFFLVHNGNIEEVLTKVKEL